MYFIAHRGTLDNLFQQLQNAEIIINLMILCFSVYKNIEYQVPHVIGQRETSNNHLFYNTLQHFRFTVYFPYFKKPNHFPGKVANRCPDKPKHLITLPEKLPATTKDRGPTPGPRDLNGNPSPEELSEKSTL